MNEELKNKLEDLVEDTKDDIKYIIYETSTNRQDTFGERQKEVDQLMPKAKDYIITLLKKEHE